MPANHPYSRLRFSIRDPNTVKLGTTHFGDAAFSPTSANCTVWWLGHKENPQDGGWENTCYETDPVLQGKWTFQVLKNATGGGSAIGDFRLRVRLEEAVVLATGGVANVRFEGEAAFKVGVRGEENPGANMGGSCGGSGVCNWGLRAEYAPVVVQQRLVGVECVAGTCEEKNE
jgi:hypothetical protein